MYEQSKKSVIKEFFSEIVVFHVRKGSYTAFNIVKIGLRKIWEKKLKILKTQSMTKKRSSEMLAVRMEIFVRKNRHSEILVLENLCRPPKLSARSPPLSKQMRCVCL